MSSLSGNKSIVKQLAELRKRALLEFHQGHGINITADRGRVLIAQEQSAKQNGVFPAIITGSSLQSGHAARWDYDFTAIVFDAATGAYMNQALTGTAINLVELAHTIQPGSGTPWYVWGVDAHDTTIATSLSPRPVGGGGSSTSHKVDIPVDMTMRITSAGAIFYTFSAVGSFYAVC